MEADFNDIFVRESVILGTDVDVTLTAGMNKWKCGRLRSLNAIIIIVMLLFLIILLWNNYMVQHDSSEAELPHFKSC